MRTEKVTINYSAEKLQAIRVLKPELYETIEKSLEECLDKLYAKAVPQSTRMYIEAIITDEEKQPKKAAKFEEKQTG